MRQLFLKRLLDGGYELDGSPPSVFDSFEASFRNLTPLAPSQSHLDMCNAARHELGLSLLPDSIVDKNSNDIHPAMDISEAPSQNSDEKKWSLSRYPFIHSIDILWAMLAKLSVYSHIRFYLF